MLKPALALFYVFLLFITNPLVCNDAPSKDLIPSAGSPQVINAEDTLIEGFSIVYGGGELPDIPREEGVHVYLDDSNYQGLIDLLSEFINKPLTNANIRDVKEVIVDYFRKVKRLYVAAVVPIQEVINNVIIIQIIEGKVDNVTFEGERWFRKKTIENAIDIHKGDPIDETAFLNSVTWANKNPFRYTQIVFVPGKEKGTADLTFITKDRFPARFSLGVDNSGFKLNDEIRLSAGAAWGDAFLLGDILTYQYLASPNFSQFQSHSFTYTTFLPSRKLFTIFGTYGETKPKLTIPYISEGKNIQASCRYEIPILPLFGDVRSNVRFGFDWKFTTSNLFFTSNGLTDSLASNHIMAVVQFLASYNFDRNWEHNLLTLRSQMVVSPFKGLFAHHTSNAFNSLREGSKVKYVYWKFDLKNIYKTENRWTFDTRLRTQIATCALPASEQFALGGYLTVRGYKELQFIADQGLCLNAEVYTPPFSFTKSFNHEISFVSFVDYGLGYNYRHVTSATRLQNLLGTGLGIRMNASRYFSGRLDYGFLLLDIEGDTNFGRFNFSVTASY